MPSLLTELRDLCPDRRLVPAEARTVAERQAHKLLRLQGVDSAPVPEQAIECIPRIQVAWRRGGRRVSGTVRWRGGAWQIIVDRSEAWVRQRFSLAHELKHVLDHPTARLLYRDRRHLAAARQAERACDYFAACLLMPKVLVRRAFYDRGIRDPKMLSRQFQVSLAAMRIRMDELKLLEPVRAS